VIIRQVTTQNIHIYEIGNYDERTKEKEEKV
jgi:hypothetical protein